MFWKKPPKDPSDAAEKARENEDILSGSTIEPVSNEADEHEDYTFENAESDALPLQLLIGYYANIPKKELKNYIYSLASGAGGLSTSALASCYYDIRKYQGGYIWELQEGGSGKGCLKSLVQAMESGTNEVIINIEGRQAKIIKRKNQAGVVSFLVSEDEKYEATPGVGFKEPLSPIVSKGYAFMVFSMIMLGFSVVSLLMSVTFKYVILNEPSQIALESTKMDMPYTKIREIKTINLETQYIPAIRYQNGKWDPVIIKEETTQPPSAENVMGNPVDQTHLNPPGIFPGMNPTEIELQQLLKEEE